MLKICLKGLVPFQTPANERDWPGTGGAGGIDVTHVTEEQCGEGIGQIILLVREGEG